VSADMIEALHEKLRHLDKMRGHLTFSQSRVQSWWDCSAPFADWSESQLESLAAFKVRFAELQDHLASAMRMVASIENEDTRTFTYVLNYMEKIEVLDEMRRWQEVCDLRNAATHDYSKSDQAKSQHFDILLQNTSYLFVVLESLKMFVLAHYSESGQTE